MDLNQRRRWNENHKKLTHMILKPAEHHAAVELFIEQHRLLHSSHMSDSAVATFEDELVRDLKEETFRQYPVDAPDTRNSIVWHVWHITRIEDMTMNVLINNDEQVFYAGDWDQKLCVDYLHSGNEMTEDEITDLTLHINIAALLDYRMEVGRNTRKVVSELSPGDFKYKVKADRINLLKEHHAVKNEALWLLDYWGKKTIAGLILMPATRHIFLHLNKSIRLKEKIQKVKL